MVIRAADGSVRGCWRLRALALTAFVLLWPHSASAQRVARDCPRLSEAGWPELEARLRVLLGVHARSELEVELRCDAASAEVVLSERGHAVRLPLAPGDELVEGTLAVVEAALIRKLAPPYELRPATAQPPAAKGPEPSAVRRFPEHEPAAATARAMKERAKPPPPRERESGLSGGIGLGLGAETWGDAWPAFGPRLHLALGHRALCAVAVESLTFGRLERRGALTFSTELGAAWGAPYASDRHLGTQVLLGYEWLSAAEHDAAPAQTSGVWSVALGARAALPIQPVSLYLGPDVRVRIGESALGPPLSVRLPSYSLLVQAGVFWIQEAMPARP